MHKNKLLQAKKLNSENGITLRNPKVPRNCQISSVTQHITRLQKSDGINYRGDSWSLPWTCCLWHVSKETDGRGRGRSLYTKADAGSCSLSSIYLSRPEKCIRTRDARKANNVNRLICHSGWAAQFNASFQTLVSGSWSFKMQRNSCAMCYDIDFSSFHFNFNKL